MPTPPKEVSTQAEYGLYLRRTHKRGGTSVGIEMARELAEGREISLEKIKRMHNFFKRHEQDKKERGFFQIHLPEYPTSGRIAWQLLGGEDGFKWCGEVLGNK